jgi:hypothetical protein
MGELRKGLERPKNEPYKWPLVLFLRRPIPRDPTPKTAISSSSMNTSRVGCGSPRFAGALAGGIERRIRRVWRDRRSPRSGPIIAILSANIKKLAFWKAEKIWLRIDLMGVETPRRASRYPDSLAEEIFVKYAYLHLLV